MRIGKILVGLFVYLTIAATQSFGVYAETDVPGPKYDIELYEYIHEQNLQHVTEIDCSRFKILLDETGDEMAAELVARRICGAVNETYFDNYDCESLEVELSREGNKIYLEKIYQKYRDGYDRDAFLAAKDYALSLLSPDMPDFVKAIVLHDYIVSTSEYDCLYSPADDESFDDYTAYGPLVRHRGVCQGFSYAYKYLMNQAGLECYLVTSDEMSHMWNMVVIDGEPYHVELTYDNETPNVLGRVHHQGLFVNDDEIAEGNFLHWGWKVCNYDNMFDYPSTSTRFDTAVWKKLNLFVTSPISYYDGKLYFAMSDRHSFPPQAKIVCTGLDSLHYAQCELIKKDLEWKFIPDQECSYISSVYTEIIGNRIYYNTPTGISSCTLEGKDIREEYKVDTKDGLVYGMARFEDGLYYTLSKDELLEEGKEGIETWIKLSDEYKVVYKTDNNQETTIGESSELENEHESIEETSKVEKPSSEDEASEPVSEEGTNNLLVIAIVIMGLLIIALIAFLIGKNKNK